MLGVGPDHLLVGTVSCLKPQKSPEDFVRVAALVCQRVAGAKCVLVGDGALRPQIEAMLAGAGAPGSSDLAWLAPRCGRVAEGLRCLRVDVPVGRVALRDSGGQSQPRFRSWPPGWAAPPRRSSRAFKGRSVRPEMFGPWLSGCARYWKMNGFACGSPERVRRNCRKSLRFKRRSNSTSRSIRISCMPGDRAEDVMKLQPNRL